MNENINILSNFFSIIPSEDLHRTWPANRTIMLRIISKEIKDIIDKKYLPIFIKLNNTRPINFKFIMNRLSKLSTICLITSLDFPDFDMRIRFENFKEILSNCELNKLILYNNNLGDKEIKSISEILLQQTNRQCSVLNFAHNKITEEGFKSLLKLLNKGQKIDLNLCNNKMGYEYKETKCIQLCSTLSSLNLCYNQISNIDINKILLNNKDLKSLDLSQNKITTFNFNININMKQNNIFILENLNISYNNIDILGAKNLSLILENCIRLKTLNISYNFIGTEGATYIIEKCLSLNSIFLTTNMITNDGMEKFIEVLIQRTTLINLTISGNRIADLILYNLSKLLENRIKLIY